MDFGVMCNELQAEYRLDKGILGTAPLLNYIINEKPRIRCRIEQNGVRRVCIISDEARPLSEMYSYLTSMERLIVVIDGMFIPLKEFTFPDEEENKDKLNSLAEHLMAQRLHYFCSAKYLSYSRDKFADYWDILPTIEYDKWNKMMNDLGVLHQMFLYASSNSGLTIDVMFAFLSELMEGLAEFYRDEFPKFANVTPQKEENLYASVNSMINCFGEVIFATEINSGKNYVKALVNSRVNIMHIKRKYRMPFLDGKEATLYAIKMNYLYRWSVFDFLGVPRGLFAENVKKNVEHLDEWNNILPVFLNRLPNIPS